MNRLMEGDRGDPISRPTVRQRRAKATGKQLASALQEESARLRMLIGPVEALSAHVCSSPRPRLQQMEMHTPRQDARWYCGQRQDVTLA
ncbi:hypothetical protein NDU88_008412 [Pleurodeles waltl]|uniref:Uncharacterized protein n=1 Tax=Pleurodeles waltl TaxID=8319 RepID=A0AAV7QSR7_PLEWA|nr:hypothetical protein NDU88_008412 [Pleurodeles waltl]